MNDGNAPLSLLKPSTNLCGNNLNEVKFLDSLYGFGRAVDSRLVRVAIAHAANSSGMADRRDASTNGTGRNEHG